MRSLLFVLALGLLQACNTAHRHVPASDDPIDTEKPEEGDEPIPPEKEKTVWGYLEEKYDRNHDGYVVPREYDRGDESFVRLDQNKDGRISQADFRRAGRINLMMSQMILMRTMQADDNAQDLHLTEIAESFPRVDKNGSGDLDESEMTAAMAAAGPRRRMPPGMKPYRAMLTVLDTDQSGTLSRAELEVFFHARDDGDGVWKRPARRGPGARPRAMSGVEPGQPAPDFTLKGPEGKRAATLSSFTGNKPVALIFGSYT